jgi:threonyl-tRNA synthetase
LSPEQIAILPISEKYHQYAASLMKVMEEYDITGSVDQRDEKIGRKIRDAEVKKIPFMLIVGEKEEQDGLVSVRKHGTGDLGQMSRDDFIKLVQSEIAGALQYN